MPSTLERLDSIRDNLINQGIGTSGLTSQAIQRANLPELRASVVEGDATRDSLLRQRLASVHKENFVLPSSGRARSIGAGGAQFVLRESATFGPQGQKGTPVFELVGANGKTIKKFAPNEGVKEFIKQNRLEGLVAAAPGRLPGTGPGVVVGGPGTLNINTARKLGLPLLSHDEAGSITGRGTASSLVRRFRPSPEMSSDRIGKFVDTQEASNKLTAAESLGIDPASQLKLRLGKLQRQARGAGLRV